MHPYTLKRFSTGLLALALASVLGCAKAEPRAPEAPPLAPGTSVQSTAGMPDTPPDSENELQPAPAVEPTAEPETFAKYVFVFLGDGMGLNQVAGTRYYQAAMEHRSAGGIVWSSDSFDSFETLGLISTQNASWRTTDSAASATAMFSGTKTENQNINYNEKTNERYMPLASTLHDAGFSVGVISTCPINHATPAAMYASVDYRYDYDEIAAQGVESGWIDFWGGGGFRGESEKILRNAADAGFEIIEGAENIKNTVRGDRPLIAIAPTSSNDPYMPLEIDRLADADTGMSGSASLADIVSAAVKRFEGRERFFIMAEAGRIDGTCAEYDAVSAFNDVIALDAAVAEAMAFMRLHPKETLIVVLADHETGGLRLSSPGSFSGLTGQRISRERFETLMEPIYEEHAPFAKALDMAGMHFGLTDLDKDDLRELEKAYAKSSSGDYPDDEIDPFSLELCLLTAGNGGVSIESGSHSSQPIPVYAAGCRAASFSGLYDNTEIHSKLLNAMGLAS